MERVMSPEQLRNERARFEAARIEAVKVMDWTGWILAVTTKTPTPAGTVLGGTVGKLVTRHPDGSIDLETPFEYLSIPSPGPQGQLGANAQGRPYQLTGTPVIQYVRALEQIPLDLLNDSQRRLVAYARYEADLLASELLNFRTNEAAEDGKSRIVRPGA